MQSELESLAFRKKYIGLFLSLMLLIGIGYCAKPAWHWLQESRSKSITQKGMKAVEEKKWEIAYQQADLGLQLNPQNEEGWRIMARIYTEARMDRALFYWQELEKRKLLTNEDRGYYLSILLALKRLDLAAEQWAYLKPRIASLSDREIQQGLDYYRLTQKKEAAVALLREVLVDRNNLHFKFLLAEFLVNDLNSKLKMEGVEILQAMSLDPGEIGIRSIELLLSMKSLSDQEFGLLKKTIQKHPLYSFRSELMLTEIEINREPRQSAGRIEKVFLEWNKKISNDGERTLLGQWLNRHKAYDLTLKLLPDSVSKSSPSLLLIRLDAAAAQKNWKLVLEILSLQPSPLEPYLIELFKARSYGELKKTRDAEAAWEKTFHLVKYQPMSLQFVAEYAIQMGSLKEAKRLYEQMSRFPNYALESHRQLLRIAELEGNLKEMISLLEKITQISPELLQAKNDLAYLNLLLNQNLEESLMVAEFLVKQDPLSLAYRTTVALAYLKRGERGRAFSAYQGISIDWKLSSPVARWIFYLVLKANEEKELSKKFESFIKGIVLRDEEKALLELIKTVPKK